MNSRHWFFAILVRYLLAGQLLMIDLLYSDLFWSPLFLLWVRCVWYILIVKNFKGWAMVIRCCLWHFKSPMATHVSHGIHLNMIISLVWGGLNVTLSHSYFVGRDVSTLLLEGKLLITSQPSMKLGEWGLLNKRYWHQFHSVFPGPSLTGPDPAFTHKHFQELMAFISWNYIMELTLIPDTDVGAVLLFWWRDRARVVLWKFGWTWDVFDLVWRAGKSARQTCCSSFKSGVSLWLDIMFMTSDGAQHVVQWISQDTYQGDIGDWGNLAIRHKHVVHTHGSD